MPKSVMVVGGSGNLGYYVANSIEKNGKIIVADITKPWYDLPRDAIYERTDATNVNSLKSVFKKHTADVIIHLVGLPVTSVCQSNPERSYELNVLSVQATLEAMRETGINRIVFASAGIAYGIPKEIPVREETPLNPHTVYGYHKAAAEYLIKAYSSLGIEYVILRLFSVISDFIEKGHTVVSTFIEKAIKKEPLTVVGEEQARDFIYAGDVAKAVTKATEKKQIKNQTINVSYGKPTRIIEIAQVIKRYFPDTEIRIEKSAEEYAIYGDNTRMRDLLGIEPMDPLKSVENIVKKYAVRSG